MPRLTKASIAALEKPASGACVTWDASLPGFGVRVTSAGAKSVILKYRTADGRQRMMTIARVGTLTLDECRDEARKLLGAVARGEDPAGDKQENRRAMLVRDLLDLYEAEGLVVQRGLRMGEAMKPMTAAYTLARLRHHVAPLLGSRQVKELTSGDLEKFVRDVTAGKTAKVEKPVDRKHARIAVRGGEGAARKVFRDLSAVLSFARRRGIIERNPAEDARVRKVDNRRTRFLNFEEITRLGKALTAVEEAGANRKAVDICRAWALTGCRRDEIAGLRWAEVDLQNGLLRLSASKTGSSIRPLGSAALALFAALRAQSEADADAEFVFPAERGDSFYTGTKRIWPAIIKHAKLPGVTPHVLRHSMGSAAASGGEALLMVGALLGHSNARSTAIYAHIDHDPAKAAANRASANVANALAGRKSNVIAIRDQQRG